MDHLPAAWRSELECEHGRIEYRELRVSGFDLDVSLFPLARQMCSLTRHYQMKNGGEAKVETRHFITSVEEGQASHARLAALGREHWSVENKNHWRRDATRWREDRSARRKPNGAKNLALLRGAILAILPMDEFDSINVAFDHYTEKRTQAIRLLTQTPPRCP